jgi:hypothetical protein
VEQVMAAAEKLLPSNVCFLERDGMLVCDMLELQSLLYIHESRSWRPTPHWAWW